MRLSLHPTAQSICMRSKVRLAATVWLCLPHLPPPASRVHRSHRHTLAAAPVRLVHASATGTVASSATGVNTSEAHCRRHQGDTCAACNTLFRDLSSRARLLLEAQCSLTHVDAGIGGHHKQRVRRGMLVLRRGHTDKTTRARKEGSPAAINSTIVKSNYIL